MSFIKNITTKYNVSVFQSLEYLLILCQLLVIASIHQPSTSIFLLFDKLLLLSKGSTVYNNSTHSLVPYLESKGNYMPQYINPAEYALELINTDFASNRDQEEQRLSGLIDAWHSSTQHRNLIRDITQTMVISAQSPSNIERHDQRTTIQKMLIPATLVHRNLIKGYRDVIAYGIRIAMYLGLAILMGTVWLRLGPTQASIVPFTNAIFYGGAFMSFMAVRYASLSLWFLLT